MCCPIALKICLVIKIRTIKKKKSPKLTIESIVKSFVNKVYAAVSLSYVFLSFHHC